jgi:quinol monooxygenase YgiN
MAEIQVIARFVACRGKEDELRALLQGVLVPTRAEPGCKSYELYASDSRGRFYLWEVWRSQAAVDEHKATPHFRHLKEGADKLVSEPFEVNILTRILTGAAAA